MLAALLVAVQAPHVQVLESPPSSLVRELFVSDDARVVGGSMQATGPDFAFAWTEADGLRVLDANSDGQAYTFALSAEGSHLVGRYFEGAFASHRSARWDVATGARVDIVPPGSQSSSARFVNTDGTVVGGVFETTADHERAYRWTESGGAVDLGTLGGLESFAKGMNADGSVIVGASRDATGRLRAFRWTPSNGMRRVAIAGSQRDTVERVSLDGGTMLGTAVGAPYPSGLYRRVVGQPPHEIPLPGADGFLVGSLLLSGDGSTVAGLASMSAGGFSAFVWSAASGTVFVAPSEVKEFSAIDDDGSTLVGWVTVGGGVSPRSPRRWTASGGAEPLSVVGAGGASPRGLTPDGDMVVGEHEIDGRVHPVLWRASEEIGGSFCGPAVPNSSGGPGTMHLLGSNALALDETVLEARGLPPGSFGYFLVSPDAGFTFPVAGSQGALCLDGAIGRFVGAGQVLAADANGRFRTTVRPSAFPTPTGAQSVGFGETRRFQAWFRDANPNVTSNFTDGASVRFY